MKAQLIGFVTGAGLLTATSAAQCTPTVTGNYRAEFGLGGLPDTPLDLADLAVALAERCGAGSLEFLQFSASYDFDNGSVQLDSNLDISLKDFVNTSATTASDFFQSPIPLTPSWSVTPCIVVEDRPITKIGGNFSLYTVSIGSGPNSARTTAEFTVCDTITVTTPVPIVIELPVHISGGVFAAESFGAQPITRGYAMLELQGTALGTTVGPHRVEVESVSVIPEQGSINETQYVQVSMPAGTSTFDIDISGKAEVEVVAQCVGLFCSITGSATAGVNFPNTISVGNFTGPGGSALPASVRIESAVTGMVYRGADDACVADLTTTNAPAGDPLYGVPDGAVTAADLQYYVNAYVAGDAAIADLTTTNAPQGDPRYGVPDGLVTATDIQYYVNQWVSGCS